MKMLNSFLCFSCIIYNNKKIDRYNLGTEMVTISNNLFLLFAQISVCMKYKLNVHIISKY
jgi:hypothetical protein